ncbi:MAG: OmpH family outer membrane protein [Halofilum sp. (in: g-proteobacteria)]|nr:OmpH family outer membrane protein [Halofilum sp. (in: g-proteobacteria)]
MRTFVASIVMALAMAPAGLLAAEPVKIGYVDIAYLIDNSPQAQAASSQLESEFGPRQQELQRKQQEFQQVQQKLQKDGLVMGEEERKRLEQRLQELKRDIQRTQQAFREELNIQRNSAFKEVRASVMKTVQNVAQEEGYDLVVGQGALYASDAVNLTQRVLERMKERYDSGQSD